MYWLSEFTMCFHKYNHGHLDPSSANVDLLAKLNDDNFVSFDNYCKYVEYNSSPKSHKFKIIHINIRSLVKNLTDVIDIITTESPDILLLCETFLHNNNSTKCIIDNYKFYNVNRSTGKGGGVGIYVKSSIASSCFYPKTNVPNPDIESIFVKCDTPHGELIVSELYRKPNTPEHYFIEYVEMLCTELNDSKDSFVIGTDQNINMLNVENTKVKKLIDVTFQNRIIPCITKPTRICKNTATLIDQIYISNNLFRNMLSSIILCDTSDHFPCVIELNDRKTTPLQSKTITGRLINDENTSRVINYLNNFNWDNLNMFTVDEAFNTFMMVLNNGLDLFMPIKTKVIKPKNVIREPWVSKGLLRSVRKCKKLFKTSMISNQKVDKIKYTEYRNQLNKIKRTARHTYYDKFFTENAFNLKKSWKVLNKLIGRTNDKSGIPNFITVNSSKIYNAQDMCNEFNKFFAGIGEKYAKAIPKSKKDFKDYLGPPNVDELEIRLINPRDIILKIRQLLNKNSFGNDNISNKLTKALCSGICLPLSVIINKSISESKIPKALKCADVVPLYKGGCHDLITNYRPISLLPVFSKLLEKIIYDQVYEFLSNSNQLHDNQFGFRKNRSCEDCVLKLLSQLCSGDKLHHLAVFLDTSKAFDSIPQHILISKLYHYGIRNDCLNWFVDYFKDRTQRVKLSKTYSDCIDMKYGIGQGTILGPLVFLITINDIFNVSKYCDVIGFADDITMYHSYHNAVTLRARIKHDLRILIDWFKANKLTLNLGKSSFIIFSKQRFAGFDAITIDGISINRVNQCTLLGLVVDKNLDWGLHVNKVFSKISSGLYAINSLKRTLPIFVKVRVYRSLVESHLLYGIKCWGPMLSGKLLTKLQVMQNNCIRSITNTKRNSSVRKWFAELGILSISNLVKLNIAKFMYKYENAMLPCCLNNAFIKKSIHEYDTRQSDKKSYLRTCIFSEGSKVWNTIPNDIKKLARLANFQKHLKNYLNRL